MQIRIIMVPVRDTGSALEGLNTFLADYSLLALVSAALGIKKILALIRNLRFDIWGPAENGILIKLLSIN